MHQIQHTVHLSDTDTTGQVYYARPLEWMEWCRVEWFQNLYGNFIKYVATTGITFFPAKISVEYKRPVFFGDHLVIELRTKEIKKVSFVFEYTIKRDQEVVLTSDITMVCFDQNKKRLGILPPDLLQHLATIAIPQES